MATHQFRLTVLAPLVLIVTASGVSGCSSDKATPAPAPTTVVAVGQPTEAPTTVIDPAPVVTEAG